MQNNFLVWVLTGIFKQKNSDLGRYSGFIIIIFKSCSSCPTERMVIYVLASVWSSHLWLSIPLLTTKAVVNLT